MFLEKVIPMERENFSRTEYPAMEHNFLFKLSIDSGMKHLDIPASFLRKLTWTHSDKNPEPGMS